MPALRRAHPPVRAVLLDCLGTLLRLDPPAPRLRAELARAGVEVSEEEAARAFAREIAYYLEHHLEGSDATGLERLRDGCATVVSAALGDPAPREVVRDAMLASLRFEAYPDVRATLERLRRSDLPLVVVSNWDFSLPDVLDAAGLGELLDGVVCSAVVGAAKPDPRPFLAALEVAGCGPESAVHVGDSAVRDVAGARGAGIRALLVDRAGGGLPRGAERAIRSLAELPALI